MIKGFKREIKLNFFDCDPAGILFFGNIFRLAHALYEEFIGTSGIFAKDNLLAYPILKTEAEFRKPMYYHETYIAELHVNEIRNSSFSILYNFYDKNNLRTATASTLHICVRKSDFKKTKLPRNLAEYLGSRENPGSCIPVKPD